MLSPSKPTPTDTEATGLIKEATFANGVGTTSFSLKEVSSGASIKENAKPNSQPATNSTAKSGALPTKDKKEPTAESNPQSNASKKQRRFNLQDIIKENSSSIRSGSRSASVALQKEVFALAKKRGLNDTLYIFVPDAAGLWDNSSNYSREEFNSYVQAIDHYYNRILDNDSMLDKIQMDYDKMDLREAYDTIFNAGIHSEEAIRIRDSLVRTVHIAENLILLQRCEKKGYFNYDLKGSKDDHGNDINNEKKRVLTEPRRKGAPIFLPDQEVPVGDRNPLDDDDVDSEESDDENETIEGILNPVCNGENRRRFKHIDIHVSNVNGAPKIPGQLTIEEYEMSRNATQRGSLAVEFLNTGVSRMYDLKGEHHNGNRSYFAPVFKHIDIGEGKVASSFCAKILISSELLRSGHMGINVDYSREFTSNCFVKGAKVLRSYHRPSGSAFTHDVPWLRLEACLKLCRERQGVKENEDFIPDTEILSGLQSEGLSGELACSHWRTITGEIKGDRKFIRNLLDWQIESLKKLGIHLDLDSYKKKLQANAEKRKKASYAKGKAAGRSAALKRFRRD